MHTRGSYGRAQLGASLDQGRGSSLGMWLLGGLALGGAVLWAKHQSDQIEKLYATAGLPYQGFPKHLREQTGRLSEAVGKKFQGLASRLAPEDHGVEAPEGISRLRKETADGV